MKKTLVKILSLSLCLLLCLPLLFSCGQKGDALSRNGIRSIRLDGDGKIELTVTVNSKKLEEYRGQKLRLYALLPGEEPATLTQKEPLAEKKISASLEFEIDAVQNGINHIYSGFAAVLEDGTFLGNTLSYLDNPEASASYTLPFAWAGASKGLTVDDPRGAEALGVSHALLPVHALLLTDGSDVYLFNGKEYRYSELYLHSLVEKAMTFRRAGMQVFAEWIADPTMTADTSAALMDLLCERLAKDGTLGAWLIAADESTTPANAAHLARTVYTALRSRNSGGRVLLLYKNGSAEQAKAFFTFFAKEIAADPFEWGAALSPLCSDTPWEETEGSTLDVSQLDSVISHLKSNSMSHRPSYIAVCGLRFSATDPEAQASALAYTYRKCTSLGAFAVFYGAQTDEQYGLLDADATPRISAEIFADIDTGLDQAQVEMINEHSDGAFSKLTEACDRHLVSGSSALGSDGQAYETLFDFSQGNTNGFWGTGAVLAPVCQTSGSLSRSVLFTWLSASDRYDEGVAVRLEDASALSGAFSINTRLLLQNEATSNSTVTLRLEGSDKKGERVSFTATATVENESWQNVIFYVGTFTAAADLTSPVLMTFSVNSDAPEGTEYPMWLDSVGVRCPEKDSPAPNALWIILGCIIGVFVICVALYLTLLILKRRREKRAGRLH